MVELESNQYKIDRFTVDSTSLTVSSAEQSIKLPVKVFALLTLFISNPNNSVQRSEAIDIIWDGNEGVGKRGYTNAMWHLRKTFTDLGAEPDEIFKTLRKVGYVLNVKPIAITISNNEDSILNSSPSKKVPTYLVTISALVIVATLTVVFVLFNQHSDNQYVENKPVSETNYQGIEEHPSVSHNGEYLAFRWVRENAKGKIYIKSLINEKEPLRLLTHKNVEESSPVWSPDDSEIAYIRFTNEELCEVRVRDIETNEDNLIAQGCLYRVTRHSLDWSPDGRYLMFPKISHDSVALFQFDLQTKVIKQVTNPTENQQDTIAKWSKDQKSIAFIREQNQLASMWLSIDGKEQQILKPKDSIIGLAWDHKANQIFTSFMVKGQYVTHKYDVSSKQWLKMEQISTPSNLSFDQVKQNLLYSQYSSSEYIVQKSFYDGREIKRVSSSYRDMYGSYSRATADVLFISNRSDSWDIWQKTVEGTTNLTQGIGAAMIPRVAPNSEYFAAVIRVEGEERFSLYKIGAQDGVLEKLNTNDLEPQNPTWSLDSQTIYFHATGNDKSGIFSYSLNDKTIKQITFNDEKYLIEGSNGVFYASKNFKSGIWQVDLENNTSKEIIKDLGKSDFASFFWENDGLFYLSRDEQYDSIIKYSHTGNKTIISQFPANTVKKYFGLAQADDQSYLVTLISANDADIYSISTSTKN